jgi:hypothetical protein
VPSTPPGELREQLAIIRRSSRQKQQLSRTKDLQLLSHGSRATAAALARQRGCTSSKSSEGRSKTLLCSNPQLPSRRHLVPQQQQHRHATSTVHQQRHSIFQQHVLHCHGNMPAGAIGPLLQIKQRYSKHALQAASSRHKPLGREHDQGKPQQTLKRNMAVQQQQHTRIGNGTGGACKQQVFKKRSSAKNLSRTADVGIETWRPAPTGLPFTHPEGWCSAGKSYSTWAGLGTLDRSRANDAFRRDIGGHGWQNNRSLASWWYLPSCCPGTVPKEGTF